ncbi:hypothetical protein Pint_28034 [Pistacia integerrima]|uniref:Uncharacterized protein n=1 Tax=Pistacia integerrima TaxID=434235 RepID=A0ACC0YSG8_9ROSI|nr:hypothetical protein Pint_28034 [Pistacia integerrima]
MGHVERICKSKSNQQVDEAKVMVQEEGEQLFVASCYASSSLSEAWLMTNDPKLFRELEKSVFSKVKVSNGQYVEVKGRAIAIESVTGTKLINDVLYVRRIDQNLI